MVLYFTVLCILTFKVSKMKLAEFVNRVDTGDSVHNEQTHVALQFCKFCHLLIWTIGVLTRIKML